MTKIEGGKIVRRSFDTQERSLCSQWVRGTAVTLAWFLAMHFLVLPQSSRANDSEESTDRLIVFDIPRQRADLALLEFAEQADITLAVRPEEVDDVDANELVGEFRVQEGIEKLLANTGLAPVLQNEMVLSVRTDHSSEERGETMTPKKNRLLAGLAAIFVGTSAGAQDASPSGELEEIVVKGIRGSLQSSAQQKQNSNVF